jgi:hypothetical protein
MIDLNTPNALNDAGGHNKVTELKVIKQFLFTYTATMKVVSVNTGILRENVCRRIAELRDYGQVCLVKKDRCPITNHKGVGFYTTNKDLFVYSPQLGLFDKKEDSND